MSTITEFKENKNIFINQLDPKINESVLFKRINDELQREAVFKVLISRDTTRYETSIAHVQMKTHEDAAEAIQKLNGKIIEGKKVNISWSMKDYKQRTQIETNLYVKGIKKEITQNQFQEVFLQYGEAISVKLSTNEKNESNGFGYVKYLTIEELEKALEKKEEIKEKIGEEEFILTKFEKQPTTLQTNLYIGNIDKNITEEQFIKYFETFGKIRENSEGKKLYAFTFVEKYDKKRGFINFELAQDAEKALKSPKEKVLGNETLVIAYYKTKLERKREWKQKSDEIKKNVQSIFKDYNLYINTKQSETNENEIREKLIDCGKIYSLKIKYIDKQPTGIAYVCFENQESANLAIEKGKVLGWEIQKLITKNDKFNSFPLSHNLYPQPYMMYPMNYYQFVNMIFSQFVKPNHSQQSQVSNKRNQLQKQKRNDKSMKKQVVEKKPVEKVKITVTEEMKNELGDDLFDYILGLGHEEELTGKITGVLLSSIEYQELKNKLEKDKESLNTIIDEVKSNLESMK